MVAAWSSRRQVFDTGVIKTTTGVDVNICAKAIRVMPQKVKFTVVDDLSTRPEFMK